MSDNLPILKRKPGTLYSNITRFVTAINEATEGTTPDDLEYFHNRLQDTLDHLTSLDDSIHGSLNDVEYATDVETCEEYIDSAKRDIYKATRAIDSRLSASMSTMRIATTTLPPYTHCAYNQRPNHQVGNLFGRHWDVAAFLGTVSVVRGHKPFCLTD